MGTRLGNVNLITGDLIKAEDYFNKALDMEQDFDHGRRPYAKFGLARVAQAKGERDKARQIAQEVLSDLVRTGPSHKLLNEVYSFLKDIE